MKLFNLSKNSEYQFTHNNVAVAFAYGIAEKKSLMSTFATSPKTIIDEHVDGQFVKGEHGFHLLDLSIPFSSIQGEPQFSL